ncbi:MAG: hypothetical protein Q8L20_03475 [Gammaproteobacteria bacterium]|nr:hypothetical protein [Gammaproteobacteria bacterium]
MKIKQLIVLATLLTISSAHAQNVDGIVAIRLLDGPIIVPDMDERMGTNIQGPSLIRVPDWVENSLGKYYLYFAEHRGEYIRLAYADAVTGPWTIYTPGTLTLEESHFPTTCPPCSVPVGSTAPAYAHIASPDVHVREDRQEIVMYLHGREPEVQVTRVAVSKDGLNFEAYSEILGRPYFRVFEHGDYYYGLAMPGFFYRSRDGISNFEEGPRFFNDDMRHSALLIRDNILYVFWTQVGHAPEAIMVSAITMEGDWTQWTESEAVELLRPEHDWEGANLPLIPSVRGDITVPANQLRDPAIFEEDGEVYLLYSVAGEGGIALAKISFE